MVFDRKKHLNIKNSDEDLIGACMGALKRVVKLNRKPGDDDTLYMMLDEANDARCLIAHRFFLEHALDLQTESGRIATNQHLGKIYLTIRQAHTAASALKQALFSKLGFTREMVDAKLAEHHEIANEGDT